MKCVEPILEAIGSVWKEKWMYHFIQESGSLFYVWYDISVCRLNFEVL